VEKPRFVAWNGGRRNDEDKRQTEQHGKRGTTVSKAV